MNNELEPNAQPASEELDVELVVATRTDRFLAALIDGLIIMAISVPILYITGIFGAITQESGPSFFENLVMTAVSLAIFAALNGKLLIAKGQTIGKQVMGTKIVTLSGDLPILEKHLLPRYGVYFIVGLIPIVGTILSLVNLLIIYGVQKRCGHDLIAGTKVVKIK